MHELFVFPAGDGLCRAILFAVAAVLLLCGVVFFVQGNRSKGKSSRFLVAMAALVGAVVYYFLGFGVGIQADGLSWQSGNKAFFWARYLDWLVTIPMLITALCLVVKVDIWEAGFMSATAILMVATSYVEFTSPGMFWMGLALSGVFLVITVGYLADAVMSSEEESRTGTVAFWVLAVALIVYPVVAILKATSGLNMVVEVILYALADIVSKAVFGFVISRSKADEVDDESDWSAQQPIQMQQYYQQQPIMQGAPM
mmetsp:Transcript_37697/g.82480  ORF Transcript_37697/g.82480 Transcript_37697/m.82480 type:complete len:256 (-) Transcript_37697:138-905(-)